MTHAGLMTQDDRIHFLSQVFVTASGCWRGPSLAFFTTADGRLRSLQPHRAMYELEREQIPAGWCVVRTCNTVSCVAPGHLEAQPRGHTRSVVIRSET